MRSIITITGPSGSGKRELLRTLASSGQGFIRAQIMTTNLGLCQDLCAGYAYASTEKLRRRRDAGDLLDESMFCGHLFALSKQELIAACSRGIAIAVVPPAGVLAIRDFAASHGFLVISAYIDAPEDVCRSRLLARNDGSQAKTFQIREQMSWKNLVDYEIITNMSSPANAERLMQTLSDIFLPG